MEAITGVFETRSAAERALNAVHQAGIPSDKITLLVPGTVDQVEKEVQSIPTDATEQPGMGSAVGGLLGGGVGLPEALSSWPWFPDWARLPPWGCWAQPSWELREPLWVRPRVARSKGPVLRACRKTKSSFMKTPCAEAAASSLPWPMNNPRRQGFAK